MSRRLQRLFGWGDVATTREDVVRVSKAGDIEELKRIMPEALAYLDSEDLDLDTMPYLYDELQRPPPQSPRLRALHAMYNAPQCSDPMEIDEPLHDMPTLHMMPALSDELRCGMPASALVLPQPSVPS